jgi:tetratricopeptide (TPR) repeat protein
VADGRRPSSNEGAPRGRSQGGRPGKSSSSRSDKPRSDKPRSDKPRSDSGRGRSDSSRGGQGRSSSGRPARKGDWSRPASEQGPRTLDQERYDGPPLPEEITGRELDRSVSGQLKGLPDKLALRVARHLAAAGVLIDSDPETAYQHTLAARARASRLAVVREATGEAAYAAGHYAEALAELRAAKRMNGATDYLPIMADCQRALGHPEQALKLAKSPAVANFSSAAKAEMTLVEAGARRDMGQLDAALRTLELAPLQSKSREPWVVRLRYAYADTLESAGRETEALAWFHRTHAVDSQDLTDAADRAEVLEKRLD